MATSYRLSVQPDAYGSRGRNAPDGRWADSSYAFQVFQELVGRLALAVAHDVPGALDPNARQQGDSPSGVTHQIHDDGGGRSWGGVHLNGQTKASEDLPTEGGEEE